MRTKQLFLIFSLLTLNMAFAQTDKPVADSGKIIVFKFDMKDEINPGMWRLTQKSLEEAKKYDASLIIIHMNTYGGLLESADSIRSAIINCEIPVYAFIDNNAASAGALISISCDRIYMRKGANIGAATVVNQTGEQLPDKYQSYMRSMMRSTAESHGADTIINNNDTIIKWYRNPMIAESMVDPRKEVEGVIDSGEVLTFTTAEAIKHGFCEGEAENIEELLQLAQINNYKIVEYKQTSLDRIIGFFMNPMVSSLLIMLIIGGIYFELQSPGIGFPLAISVFAAILFFAPLYLEGIAENWEVILFIIGLLLLGVEIFAIPGFGVAGISGIILIVAGLTLSLVDNVVFNYQYNVNIFEPVIKALFLVVISMLISIVLSIYLTNKLLTSGNKAFSFLVLKSSQLKEEGYIGVDREPLNIIGRNGISFTVLRPSGKVMIDNEIYDAKAMDGFIDKNEAVVVMSYESGQIYVRKIT